MPALYSNLNAGAITDNPLAIGATTINSANFASLPTVASPDYLWITLDPTNVAGVPELVKVTAHTAAATVCTIARGQQSTTARAHLLNTIWRHSLTKDDLDSWSADVQIFLTSGTWTKPSWAASNSLVTVMAIGGGGGGASGDRTTAGLPRPGGGGAGGGACVMQNFRATDLGATVAATVGTGGAGGVAQGTDNVIGNAGTTGNSTTFGSLLIARGGIRGLSVVAGLGGAGVTGIGGGGTSYNYGAAGVAGTPDTGFNGGGGGGGGGGLDASNVAYGGGGGGARAQDNTGGGTAGATGAVGGAGTASTANIVTGGGGGGGGGAHTGSGGATGGAGALYGGGGGGGGGTLNGFASGAGGAGSTGILIVITTR